MIVTGVAVVTLPLILFVLVFLAQGKQLSAHVKEDLTAAGIHEIDAQINLVVRNAQVARELVNRDVKKVVEMADLILDQRGGVRMDFTDSMVEWSAVNQFSKREERLKLPSIRLGDGTEIIPQKSFDVTVPVVDEITALTNDTATIFQRMNDRGDMLCVATNVDNNGMRAVGTYIPATNPDGTDNAVVSTVLSGKDYVGRAFFVDQWYMTVYRPLFDSNGQVSGILYVGTPELVATRTLLDNLMDIKIGKSGYITILNTRGDDAGRYVLSYNGEKDGEVILGLKDSEGRQFIKDMVDEAVSLKDGEIGSIQYPYSADGQQAPRDKIVHYTYFPEWDWLIALGSFEDEFYEKIKIVHADLELMAKTMIAISLVGAIIAGLVFMYLTRGVVRPIEGIIGNIQNGSGETTSAANEVSSASQHLAEVASDQAASLEQAHASMQTMNELVDRNSQIAQDTRHETSQSNKDAREGVASMHTLLESIQQSSEAVKAMGEVIAEIKESSNAVSRIIGTIDEIAFQTNILALNAAVEAARAGEAGAGFAVVADEVRSLAHRAAEAARETASMIGESVKSSERGVVASDQVSTYLESVEEGSVNANKLLEGIADSIQRINSSMGTIEDNSQEQNAGIGQLTELFGHMNELTQQNAASAEETASASEELNAQASSLQGVVGELAGVIYGAGSINESNQQYSVVSS